MNYFVDGKKNFILESYLSADVKQKIKKYIFPYKVIANQHKEILRLNELLPKELEELDLSADVKQKIKKYIFPYKFITNQHKEILRLNELLPKVLLVELDFKKNKREVKIKKEENIKLSNNLTLQRYNLVNGFYQGILNTFPGSGYIDFHQKNLFILSSRGVLAHTKNIDNGLNFKQVENNINDFIGVEQFKKEHKFSLKGLLIFNNLVFVSYTEEIKEDCWNTSVIFGDISYKKILFRKLFSNKECIHSLNNIDGEFQALQAGGKIINFDDDHILLSVGEYRSRFLAQEKNSINGKIIKININNSDYEIVSMGHRNSQGLYFDKEKNFILETEHGPYGGDEINLIEVNEINKNDPLNYGWALASAGDHYGGKNDANEIKYKKYPLYKSHSEHGFIEPLKTFPPNIGISEIIRIRKNKYVAGSLKDQSLYFFELNNKKKIINLERVKVFERIRSLKFKDYKLYLFLEDTPSIGIISLR
jgi:hypothetical protein